MKQASGKRVPNAGSWKPGVSGNPNGRPRTGLALAEKIRERFDPDLLCDIALTVANDPELPATAKLAALMPFVALGFVKPPTSHELAVTQDNGASQWDSVPIEKRRELLAVLQAARLGHGDHRLDEPQVYDDEFASANRSPTGTEP